MAKVIYTPENVKPAFCDLSEGTYFDYEGSLYLFVDEDRDLVFDFEEEISFRWTDEYDLDAKVQPIASDRVTIKVD